jgi:hypothetical protein
MIQHIPKIDNNIQLQGLLCMINSKVRRAKFRTWGPHIYLPKRFSSSKVRVRGGGGNEYLESPRVYKPLPPD